MNDVLSSYTENKFSLYTNVQAARTVYFYEISRFLRIFDNSIIILETRDFFIVLTAE